MRYFFAAFGLVLTLWGVKAERGNHVLMTGALSGRSWVDIDYDGIKDSGEPGLSGVTVSLFQDNNADGNPDGGPVETIVTPSDGSYLFSSILVGKYIVGFTPPAGYFPTKQLNTLCADFEDSDIDNNTSLTGTIMVVVGQIRNGNDAGFFQKCSLGNWVWKDTDYDGVQDTNEPGLGGLTVELYTSDNLSTPVKITMTSASGLYIFSNVLPGTYRVRFIVPPVYLLSIDPEENNIDPATGFSNEIVLSPGEVDLTVDAGYFITRIIGDFVWEDLNRDGIRQDIEPPLSGVAVFLYADQNTDGVPDGGVISAASTNTFGYYTFADLDIGKYVVRFNTPLGYIPTSANMGAEFQDSDINPATGFTETINLTDWPVVNHIDAGFYASTYIGDKIWHDRKRNGLQDDGEPGLAGVNVQLYSDADMNGIPDGSAISSKTTNDAGIYRFVNIPPGNYVVGCVPPPEYMHTIQFAGVSDSIDSNIDPVTGFTGTIQVSLEDNVVTQDAGFYKNASIGNYVWEDENHNGQQDPDEHGIAGVQVKLFLDENENALPDGPELISYTTDESGFYLFSEILPGNYVMQFVAPGNYLPTMPCNFTGDDSTDSEINPVTGYTNTIHLFSGETSTNIDGGFFRLGAIGNKVWEDVNHNGIQDTGEPGIAGIVVQLYADTNNDQLPDDAPLASTNTNTSGTYYLSQVVPGSYIIGLSVPFGYVLTTFRNPAATDDTDSDILPTGLSPTIELLSGVIDTIIDAGLFTVDTSTFVKGTVLFDANDNCLETPGEIGIANRVVRVSNDVSSYYGWTAPNGSYRIAAQPGEFEVSLLSSSVGSEVCINNQPIVLPMSGDSAVALFLEKLHPCPQLEVYLTTPLFRRCLTSTYWISYSNNSPVIAENAVITLVLDSLLTLNSAQVPYTIEDNNTYTFSLGNVLPFTTEQFTIGAQVSCNAILGQTLCSEVHITPDASCLPPDPLWSGALLDLSSECDVDSLRFTFENIGTGTMSEALEYIVIEDGIMSRMEVRNPLPAGGTMTVSVPANGSTWRVEARQEPLAPTAAAPVLSVEGCTTTGSFSTGFVNQFVNNEADPTTDVDCTVVTGSYDPNDKNGIPTGYGEERALLPGTEIEYMIRFQNTGTDTAFTVVILDTLSAWLDPSTIWPLAASHPYTFDLTGPGVGVFRFDNILLPDSTINEEASHGFVKFRVRPRAETPLGTNIYNQAAIYFDYNDPILTNYTRHRIDSNFVTLDLWTPVTPQWQVRIVPNPASEQTIVEVMGVPVQGHFRLQLYDATGKVVRTLDAESPSFPLHGQQLDQGVYWLDIRRDGDRVGRGKLMVH